MQKYANLVDLFKSFPTSIYLQKFASIQPRTSPLKFARSQPRGAGRDGQAVQRPEVVEVLDAPGSTER